MTVYTYPFGADGFLAKVEEISNDKNNITCNKAKEFLDAYNKLASRVKYAKHIITFVIVVFNLVFFVATVAFGNQAIQLWKSFN